MVVCSHPQARVCRNLRYSLGHLKSRDKQTYLAILDGIVMGPSHISANEAEALLNINSYLFKKSAARRSELISTGERPAWWGEGHGGLLTIWEHQPRLAGMGKRRPVSISSSSLHPLEQARQAGRGAVENIGRTRSRLEQQFCLFARFGHLNSQTRAQGDLITLSQSDKWLRQAKVIDGWNVTTTDTAIAFRKISRGSTRLSYPGWLVFLRELAETKKLPLPQVWARLEQSGRPTLNSRLLNSLEDRGNSSGGSRSLSSSHDLRKNVFHND